MHTKSTVNTSSAQNRAVVLKKFGPKARIETKNWPLMGIKNRVPLTYVYVGDVIKAIGKDLADLLV